MGWDNALSEGVQVCRERVQSPEVIHLAGDVQIEKDHSPFQVCKNASNSITRLCPERTTSDQKQRCPRGEMG